MWCSQKEERRYTWKMAFKGCVDVPLTNDCYSMSTVVYGVLCQRHLSVCQVVLYVMAIRNIKL